MNKVSEEETHLRTVALENARLVLAERCRAEAELRNVKDSLQRKADELSDALAMTKAVLEATTDAILATSGEKKVTAFNRRYLELWGITPDIVQNEDHSSFLTLCALSLIHI